jgi:hypothetical protein
MMRRLIKNDWKAIIVLILILGLLLIEQNRIKARVIQNSSALADLQSMEELQAQFNQDRGSPRLVLLLSPT